MDEKYYNMIKKTNYHTIGNKKNKRDRNEGGGRKNQGIAKACQHWIKKDYWTGRQET